MNLTITPQIEISEAQSISVKALSFGAKKLPVENKRLIDETLKAASAAATSTGLAFIALNSSTNKPESYESKCERLQKILENEKDAMEGYDIAEYIMLSVDKDNIDSKLKLYDMYKNHKYFENDNRYILFYMVDGVDNSNFELAKDICDINNTNGELPMNGVLYQVNKNNMSLAKAMINLKDVDKEDLPDLLEGLSKRSAKRKLAMLKMLKKDNILKDDSIYNIVNDTKDYNALYKIAVYDTLSKDKNISVEKLGDAVANAGSYTVYDYIPDFEFRKYEELEQNKKYSNIF